MGLASNLKCLREHKVCASSEEHEEMEAEITGVCDTQDGITPHRSQKPRDTPKEEGPRREI